MRNQALEAREARLQKDFERREAAMVKEMQDRCNAALSAFEEQARGTIQQITESAEQRKAAEQAMRKVARTRREFQEKVSTDVLRTAAPVKTQRVIEEGSRIRLRGVREPARVRRKLSDDRLEVEIGLMRMQVSVDDVEEVLSGPDKGEKTPKNISFQQGPAWNTTYREINVIGKRAEEATDEIDKFLDSAALASVDRVRIVHGHGMGVLKRAVSELLAHNPHVAKYYPASPAEGGTGATIAEMKQ
jgi:DNA mismatch repair protein MutS2